MNTVIEAIESMAQVAMRAADNLARIANKMRDEKDLAYAGDAVNCVSNMMLQMKLELIPMRIIRLLTQNKEDDD